MFLNAHMDDIPPTDHALRMRPWFIATLFVNMAIVVGKFVISDWWGAISLLCVVLMGVLVLQHEHGISGQNAFFYSVMAMISGIFDVISCMLYFQHSKFAPFQHDAPTMVVLAQVIFIVSPIALFVSAAISYNIFSDMVSHEEELLLGMGGHGGMQQQPFPDFGAAQQQQQQRQQGQGDQRFQQFQGQGYRLGA